jgi:hypothetical protein
VEPSSSDGDGGLSDSDPDPSSGDDGCSSGGEQSRVVYFQAKPMVKPGGAALTGIQERWQVLELDLPQIPQQDSACNTYALEHGLA